MQVIAKWMCVLMSATTVKSGQAAVQWLMDVRLPCLCLPCDALVRQNQGPACFGHTSSPFFLSSHTTATPKTLYTGHSTSHVPCLLSPHAVTYPSCACTIANTHETAQRVRHHQREHGMTWPMSTAIRPFIIPGTHQTQLPKTQSRSSKSLTKIRQSVCYHFLSSNP